MYLLDTNVLSEVHKGARTHPGIVRFFSRHQDAVFFLGAQTIGKVQRGIENLRYRSHAARVRSLDAWLGAILREYSGRILPFDSQCAQLWGRLMSPDGSHPVDKQLAAIALLHGLILVTRNVAYFRSTGVALLDPFSF
ncbi:type II toxin-antitoxin system VapC family toxin [Oxalobacteraceae bacterium A2-2]